MKKLNMKALKNLREHEKSLEEGNDASRKYYNLPEGVEDFRIGNEITKFDILAFRLNPTTNSVAQTISDDSFPKYEVGGNIFSIYYSAPYFLHKYQRAPKNQMEMLYERDALFKLEEKFVCPNKTYGKPCPVCDAEWEYKQSIKGENWKDPEIKEQLKKFNVVKYHLYWVYDYSDKQYKVWNVCEYDFAKLVKMELSMLDDEDETDDDSRFWEWDSDGRTLKVGSEKTAFGSKESPYYKPQKIMFKPRACEHDENVLAKTLVDPSEFLVAKTPNEISEFLKVPEIDMTTTEEPKTWEPKTETSEKPKEEAKDDDDNLDYGESKKAAKPKTKKVGRPKKETPKEPKVEEPNEPEASKEEATGKCPFGHTFGSADMDDIKDDCDKCDADLWAECDALRCSNET